MTPLRPREWYDWGTQAFYFYNTRRIADLVMERYPRAQDQRHTAPDPTRHQTLSGLYLESDGIGPCAIWTPWGHWEFRGTTEPVPDLVRPSLTKLLTLKPAPEFGPLVQEVVWIEGPTHGLCGAQTAAPDCLVPAEETLRLWQDIAKSYWPPELDSILSAHAGDQDRRDWARRRHEIATLLDISEISVEHLIQSGTFGYRADNATILARFDWLVSYTAP